MKSFNITIGALKEILTLAEVLIEDLEGDEVFITESDINSFNEAINILKEFGTKVGE